MPIRMSIFPIGVKTDIVYFFTLVGKFKVFFRGVYDLLITTPAWGYTEGSVIITLFSLLR